MKIKNWIFFSIITLTSVTALGKTLVVTHAETLWDPLRVAGPATRELLAHPAFKSKLALYSYRTDPTTLKPNTFTFSKNGLKFHSRFSEDGELKFRLAEPEVYVAGGYWEACLSNTILDLIDNSSPSAHLVIHVMMKAVFTTGDELPEPDEERGIYNEIRTLDEFFQRNPTAFLGKYVLPIGQYYMTYRMKSSPNKQPTKEYLTVDFMLDGRTVATFGHGPRKISIILERDFSDI